VHPYLKKSHGFACRICQYRTTSEKLFNQHIRGSRDSLHQQNIGDSHNLRDIVWLQSWVQEGPRQYWIVRTNVAITPNPVPRRAPLSRLQPETSIRLNTLHQSERIRIADRQNALLRTADENDREDLTLTTPWMQRTQWSETYRNARRDILAKAARLPGYQSYRWGQQLGLYQEVSVYTHAADERRLRPVLLAID
jgi:hypothetical protein